MWDEKDDPCQIKNPCYTVRMYVLISFILAILPSLFLVRYYYKQDRLKPEPKGLIIKIFLLGIAGTCPAIILEWVISGLGGLFSRSPLLSVFFKAFLVAALVEEVIKLQIVKIFAYNNVHFDEVMDGIVYLVVASLGFACMENILFVTGGGLRVALMRAFTSVPLHAIASGIMGYYVGKAKLAGRKEEESSLIYKGLMIAILVHGTYDLLLFLFPFYGLVPALGIIPLLVWGFSFLKRKIKLAIAEDVREGRTRPPVSSSRGEKPSG